MSADLKSIEYFPDFHTTFPCASEMYNPTVCSIVTKLIFFDSLHQGLEVWTNFIKLGETKISWPSRRWITFVKRNGLAETRSLFDT
jgi:hypothetical protein